MVDTIKVHFIRGEQCVALLKDGDAEHADLAHHTAAKHQGSEKLNSRVL